MVANRINNLPLATSVLFRPWVLFRGFVALVWLLPPLGLFRNPASVPSAEAGYFFVPPLSR
jgi:hypothetical protein